MNDEKSSRCWKSGSRHFNSPVRTANENSPTEIYTCLGGNPFNVAKDLVNLKYPHDCITCIGAVGDDVFGNLFANEPENIGVGGKLYTVQKCTTSKIFMLQVEHEDTRYYFDSGANAFLPSHFIISKIKDIRPGNFYTGETGNLKSGSMISDQGDQVNARIRKILTE